MTLVKIVTPFLSGFGGTERVIQTLLEGTSKSASIRKRFTFELVLLGGTLDFRWTKGTKAQFFWLRLPKWFRKVEYLFKLPGWCCTVLKERGDVLICTNPYIWALLWTFKTLQKKPVIIIAWYHFSLAQKPVIALLLRASDKYLAISSGIQRELIARGIQQSDIGLVFNPVLANHELSLIPAPKSQRLDLIYIGRFDYHGQKNVSEIFLALSMVKDPFTLRIFGKGKDQKKLERLAKQLGIAGNIRFEGFSSNVWAEVGSADALLLSSKFEGLPLVLIESIAHGVPVVSSDCPTGPEDIVQDGKNGFLYKMGEIKEFSERIKNIKKIRKDYSPEAIAATVQSFNADKYVERFINLTERWTDSNVK
ncbi:glycosyltransferase [Lacticaseibacillus chiayiensis]|uniref:glycosyltransferase n=1 Tax=Lacticaseibacillus chiayiensis TaxID=2100821 RepID=UPI003C789616